MGGASKRRTRSSGRSPGEIRSSSRRRSGSSDGRGTRSSEQSHDPQYPPIPFPMMKFLFFCLAFSFAFLLFPRRKAKEKFTLLVFSFSFFCKFAHALRYV